MKRLLRMISLSAICIVAFTNVNLAQTDTCEINGHKYVTQEEFIDVGFHTYTEKVAYEVDGKYVFDTLTSQCKLTAKKISTVCSKCGHCDISKDRTIMLHSDSHDADKPRRVIRVERHQQEQQVSENNNKQNKLKVEKVEDNIMDIHYKEDDQGNVTIDRCLKNTNEVIIVNN